jgi:hypothetical protein
MDFEFNHQQIRFFQRLNDVMDKLVSFHVIREVEPVNPEDSDQPQRGPEFLSIPVKCESFPGRSDQLACLEGSEKVFTDPLELDLK